MNVSNVSAQDEKRMRMSILPSGIVGRDARTLGIQELGKVVEDAEHALVVVEQLRSGGSAGLAILLELLRRRAMPAFWMALTGLAA